ncbi:MAG: GNAT family N-acetyltransferase [Myxococcales bacterium]|nr:GNAT family N-acetyltransferase [Myxococcales bacterium]
MHELKTSVLNEVEALRPWLPQWQALAVAGGQFFVSPTWLLPWWEAFGAALRGQLAVIIVVEGETLVGLAPLYLRKSHVALLEVTEVRLLGDAGPRPAGLDFLAAADKKDRVGALLALAMRQQLGDWDVIDLAPLADPSPTRAQLLSRLAAAGLPMESSAAAGSAYRVALSLLDPNLAANNLAELSPAYALRVEDNIDVILRSISALGRLSRLEWAERDETSPLGDPESAALLGTVMTERARDGAAWCVRVDDAAGEAVAVALMLDDGERSTMVAAAVDPHDRADLSAQLIRGVAAAAAARGRGSLDVMSMAAETALPTLPLVKRSPVAVRIWNRGAAASLHRTYAGVRRGAKVAREAPLVAAAQARAAWSKIREVASHVAAAQRYELMRGQLWTRGITAHGFDMAWMTELDWGAMTDLERTDMLVPLGLNEAQVADFFARGDQAFIARRDRKTAGIVWVSRGRIRMPELGRDVSLGKYDCIVHNVFVAPAFRGQSIAPALLDLLAGELRQLDLYRSWSLVPANHAAPLRAFRKAGFTPVCDVTVARLGRISISPPDPEAKELLGLTRPRGDTNDA